MAEIAYRPQLAICDLFVDTTGAALWATPEMAKILNWSGMTISSNTIQNIEVILLGLFPRSV